VTDRVFDDVGQSLIHLYRVDPYGRQFVPDLRHQMEGSQSYSQSRKHGLDHVKGTFLFEPSVVVSAVPYRL
jgi:hypothetical protein